MSIEGFALPQGLTPDEVLAKRDHLNTLYRIGATLAAELDLQKIVQTVTDEATALSGAEFGAFFYNVISDGGEAYMLYTLSGVPREAFSKFPMPRNTEIFDPTFRGLGVVRLDDVMADPRYGKSAPYHGMPKGHLPVRSYLAVPVVSRSREVLGGLFFGHSRIGMFTEEHERLVSGVAGWAALAIDNARLFQQAQHARRTSEQSVERIQRVQAITAALAEALTPAAVAETVLRESLASLGASGGVVALLDGRVRQLEVIHTSGYSAASVDAWKTLSIDARVPVSDAARECRMILVTSPQDLADRYPALVSVSQVNGNGAWVAIPLMIDARCSGVLAFSFGSPRTFNEADQAFLLNLARLCAQALQRAQLFESEQNARADAEYANRAKDEFLAVLSHELRTPMNAIMGWATLLKSGASDGRLIARAVEVIERNARVQTQLIEDLLDVSRIVSGKLRLEIKPVDLHAIVAAAVETVRAAAEGKGIHLEIVADPMPAGITGDPDRLQQVVWNLLSNAVKFTPRGGRIRIEVHRAGDQAEIAVIDSGAGIAPEFLTHVFERFRQADTSTTRSHGGLGLGLAIVRSLVEAHGGAVAVESAGEHQGATFRVLLPIGLDVAPPAEARTQV